MFLYELAIKNNSYKARREGLGGGFATLDKAGGSSDIMVNIAASFSVNFIKPYCVYLANIKRQQQFREGAASVQILGAANTSAAN